VPSRATDPDGVYRAFPNGAAESVFSFYSKEPIQFAFPEPDVSSVFRRFEMTLITPKLQRPHCGLGRVRTQLIQTQILRSFDGIEQITKNGWAVRPSFGQRHWNSLLIQTITTSGTSTAMSGVYYIRSNFTHTVFIF
jgi:hypothetical protein